MVNELYHFGIKGMKWGVRRYQNEDGSLTEAGIKRYHKLSTQLKYVQTRGYNNPRKSMIKTYDLKKRLNSMKWAHDASVKRTDEVKKNRKKLDSILVKALNEYSIDDIKKNDEMVIKLGEAAEKYLESFKNMQINAVPNITESETLIRDILNEEKSRMMFPSDLDSWHDPHKYENTPGVIDSGPSGFRLDANPYVNRRTRSNYYFRQ